MAVDSVWYLWSLSQRFFAGDKQGHVSALPDSQPANRCEKVIWH